MTTLIAEDLSVVATDLLEAAIAQARAEHRRAFVALSGGSTPKAWFRHLRKLGTAIAYDRLELFWGDERPVLPDDPESNYGQALDLWLRHVDMDPAHINPWATEFPPQEAARRYEQLLKSLFPADPWPVFDLVFLGIGPEGHTASLFPGSRALTTASWTAAPFVGEKSSWRLTLSTGVINHAHQVVFLAEGAEKAPIIQAVTTGPFQGSLLPAQWIAPKSGRLLWLTDEAAQGARA